MGGLSDVDRPLIQQRDRPLLPWMIAAAVALAVLGVAAAFYYAPLDPGAVSVCPEDAEIVPPAETEDGVEGDPVCLMTHVTDGPVTFGGSVRNTGMLPITVQGLAFDSAVEELLAVEEVLVSAATSGEADRPLAPFRLGPGAERAITVHARMRPCDPRREGVVVSVPALPVRTTFLGITRVATVPLRTEFAVLLEDCG